MPVIVFCSNVSGSREIKTKQNKIFHVLDGKKIAYETVDISEDSKKKDLMRNLAKNSTALPPQICNGNNYCGDYDAFDSAVEEGTLEKFLKL
ncbi:SH3 domain-binding glutamic acid-rich-like protein 3 [Sander vitreus]